MRPVAAPNKTIRGNVTKFSSPLGTAARGLKVGCDVIGRGEFEPTMRMIEQTEQGLERGVIDARAFGHAPEVVDHDIAGKFAEPLFNPGKFLARRLYNHVPAHVGDVPGNGFKLGNRQATLGEAVKSDATDTRVIKRTQVRFRRIRTDDGDATRVAGVARERIQKTRMVAAIPARLHIDRSCDAEACAKFHVVVEGRAGLEPVRREPLGGTVNMHVRVANTAQGPI